MQTSPTPRKRPWLQISLRTFLLLFTCIAIFFGTIGREMVKRQHRVAVIEHFRSRNVLCIAEQRNISNYDNVIAFLLRGNTLHLNPSIEAIHSKSNGLRNSIEVAAADELEDEDIPKLKAFPELNRLQLVGETKLSSKGYAAIGKIEQLQSIGISSPTQEMLLQQHLNPLPKLSDVFLFDMKIEPSTITALANLPQLKSLRIDSCNFATDLSWSELEHLESLQVHGITFNFSGGLNLNQFQALSNLKRLAIYNSRTDMSSLKTLQKLSQLRELIIFGSNIDDSAIETFECLTNLQKLKITRSEISAAGIQKLRQSCPELIINSDALRENLPDSEK
jgi:hypothetical protein